MEFLEGYLNLLYANITNYHEGNWDEMRFGPKKESFKTKLSDKVRIAMYKKGYYKLSWLMENLHTIKKFELLYNLLQSTEDKELLLKVVGYRFLGHRKIRLPLSNPGYFEKLASLSQLQNANDTVTIDSIGLVLNKTDLAAIGYPIQLYYNTGGLMANFVVKQYEYNKNGHTIKAEKGDYVLDAGACFGDTALYFANEVGNEGKVFSFEFIPENINVFKKNLSLNPGLKSRVELVERPLWKDSETQVYFEQHGPGSAVSFTKQNGSDGVCTSVTIDDFMAANNIPRIDFIKMDIEGAETSALMGAAETIKKHKPKLAIALYHHTDDFERIPKLIKELAPEYKFYFSHCTIHHEESMLFATVE